MKKIDRKKEREKDDKDNTNITIFFLTDRQTDGKREKGRERKNQRLTSTQKKESGKQTVI